MLYCYSLQPDLTFGRRISLYMFLFRCTFFFAPSNTPFHHFFFFIYNLHNPKLGHWLKMIHSCVSREDQNHLDFEWAVKLSVQHKFTSTWHMARNLGLHIQSTWSTLSLGNASLPGSPNHTRARGFSPILANHTKPKPWTLCTIDPSIDPSYALRSTSTPPPRTGGILDSGGTKHLYRDCNNYYHY